MISALSSFISMHDGNTLSADQFGSDVGTFFMRWGYPTNFLGAEKLEVSPVVALVAVAVTKNPGSTFLD